MVMSGNQVDDPTTAEVDFLVALEHARLVESVLGDFGVTAVTPTDSTALGLTRLVGTLTRDSGAKDPARDPVEQVLALLREHFGGKYAGWSPVMGKNRLVGGVNSGGGTVSHGGGPDPVPAGAGSPRSGRAGAGVTVGVLDTALFASPDLAGGYLASAPDDFLAQATDGAPWNFAAGHATFVTGLVLREAPGAAVRVRRVLNDFGEASSWDVANAIVELGRTGLHILNLSLVCYTDDGLPPLGLATAIDRLDPEVLVIACAGNHGDPDLNFEDDMEYRRPAWPAALDDVVAVGSARAVADEEGPGYELSPFTPHGAAWIDVVTPGEDVESTYFTGYGDGRSDGPEKREPVEFTGWAKWGGTSFSAALLAGRVAAVASEKGISARAAYRSIMAPLTLRPQEVSGPPPVLPPFLDL
jgi:hypothetical protein